MGCVAARLCAAVIAVLMPRLVVAQQAIDLPLKYAGAPTTAAITAGDLMTRLYRFADDSLMGRQYGTINNVKAAAFIEREVRRLGLTPAGDSGAYYQYLPNYARAFDTSSRLMVGTTSFKGGTDFLMRNDGRLRAIPPTSTVFLGMQYDTLEMPSIESMRGKIAVMTSFVRPAGFDRDGFVRSKGYATFRQLEASLGIGLGVDGDELDPASVRANMRPRFGRLVSQDDVPLQVSITTRVAEAIFGAPLSGVPKGAAGKPVAIYARFTDSPRDARNVVAILPGSDPLLKSEYVVISAHSDGLGVRSTVVDHDSVRAAMQVGRPQGGDSPPVQLTPAQSARVRTLTDSLRALHGGARPDSIFNGADQGSGAVSLLEIAEALAGNPVRPRRTIVFVWHTGGDAGLSGAGYFTDHPAVPRGSIVAQFNIDGVGRGGTMDVTGTANDGQLLHGGPRYLQLVGARRLSSELGDIIERVNADEKLALAFDYSMDAPGHPQGAYCRGAQYKYARFGIPAVAFSTGTHADYRQPTDEPQYVDYAHMADITRLVYAAARTVANMNHRPLVDRAKPNPNEPCIQ